MFSLRVEFDRANLNDARDISLPSEASHRDVGVNPDVCFASDRSGRWYAQTKQNIVRWYSMHAVHLSVNGTPAKGCVRLQAGDVLELTYQGGVQWRAVLLEEQSPSAIVQSSKTSLFDVLGGHDVLSEIITQLGGHSWYPGHSTSTYALAATCRAGRAAVDRWLAPLIPQLRQRSLCQLMGENWPLTVLHAKVDAMTDACEAELVAMLTPHSLYSLGSFPFAAHIQRVPAALIQRKVRLLGLNGRPELNGCVGTVVALNHEHGRYIVMLSIDGGKLRVAVQRSNFEPLPVQGPVPAPCTLLEKPSPDALASLCARIPAGAACLEALGSGGSSSSSHAYEVDVHEVQQALIRRLTTPIQRAPRRLRVT